MKVYIGPYKNWVGPYQIADLLQYVGVSEERCDKIGEWLSKTWLNNFCQWVYGKTERKVKVRIDPYDTWNCNTTLAYIILPMLKQLKETNHGYFHTDYSDGPVDFKLSDDEGPNEWDRGYSLARYNYIMDEMIWTFEQLQEDYDWEEQYVIEHGEIDWEASHADDAEVHELKWKKHFVIDHEGRRKHHARIQNGLRLFGKYYQNLWD